MRTCHIQLLDPTFIAMYILYYPYCTGLHGSLECFSSFHAVFLPAAIQNQMIFSQFTMMKMFLSAVTAGGAIY